MIKVFEQGQSDKKDAELYALIGRWLVDIKIHQLLGTAITANAGDVWFVSVPEKGLPRGFANARLMKNGKMHIRFVYCEDKAPMICNTLIKKFLNVADDKGCKEIYTNDTSDKKYWGNAGFKFTAPSRGKYGKWVKTNA